MKTLTTDMLRDLGINKNEEESAEIVAYFNEQLEERVGMTILDALDEEKATQLMDLSAKEDQNELAEWLQLNVPEYEEIVQTEFDILLGELAEDADKL